MIDDKTNEKPEKRLQEFAIIVNVSADKSQPRSKFKPEQSNEKENKS